MRYFIFLSCLSFLSTCNQDKKLAELYDIADVQTALDTLQRYEKFDKVFFKNENIAVFKDKISEFEIAVVVSEKQLCIFEKKDDGPWHLDKRALTTDYAEVPDKIELLDLNGDNYEDLKMTHYEGAYGFSYPKVYLFQAKDSTFKHNPNFDLSEISYDAQTNLVHTHAYVPHIKEKNTYKIVADSLQLLEQLLCYQGDYIDDEEAIYLKTKYPSGSRNYIFHFKMKNNKKQIYKVIEDKSDTTNEASDYFYKTLWKTNFFNGY